MFKGVSFMRVVTSTHDIGHNKKFAKRLLHEEKFDLIHMHLKQGEQLSEHHAKEEVLVIIRMGKVEFNFEGKKVTLTNEDILHMECNEKHSVFAIEETDLILLKVKQ